MKVSRKSELMSQFINGKLNAEELIDIIIVLEDKIDSAIGFTDYEWDSQSSQLRTIRETLNQ